MAMLSGDVRCSQVINDKNTTKKITVIISAMFRL
jgi:hypothetical protein